MRILAEMRQRLARLIWPCDCSNPGTDSHTGLTNWLVVNTWHETKRWPYYRIVEDGLTLIEADDIAQGHEAYKVIAGNPERSVQGITGPLVEI